MRYNRNYNFFGILFISIVAILLVGSIKYIFLSKAKDLTQKSDLAFALQQELPFNKGEQINYNVWLYGIKIGTAQLSFVGKTALGNKEAELIILTTRVSNLKDLEKIYVDRQSFLPLRVERSVTFFGKKMQIVEEYNTKENNVFIYKTEGGKTTKGVIKSTAPMQNIISLIFLVRKSGMLDIGQKVSVVLPLFSLEMSVTKLVDFNTANNKFKAYLLESSPKKYRIWIDQSSKKIPLRLEGVVGFGNTVMVMKKFIPGEN